MNPILNYEPSQAWPPAPYDEMLNAMRTWTAWWTGDTEELVDIYKNPTIRRDTKGLSRRKSLPGLESDKFFWGRPNDQGTARRHVTAAASVARASSALLFSKPPRISPAQEDEQDKALAARITKIFGPKAYGGELVAAGELCSFLGGVYLRPWMDRAIAQHVIPSHVAADRALPEFRMGRLIAVTFWNEVSDPEDGEVYRHLERHEPGHNFHYLFRGTESELGERAPLGEHPATSWLASTVDEETGGLETGIEELDVVYIPNVQPNRTWHNFYGLAPLGRSDYDGIESDFDALDEIHTSWMRDIKDAKSRIFVDEMLLEDLGPGQGGAYDPEQHVYTKIRSMMGAATDGAAPIMDVKFDIRWNEHAQSSAEVKQRILEHVGISSQHFADGPLSVGATATEVNSRNGMTTTTRSSKATFWERGLSEFVWIVMQLDAIHFKTGLAMSDMPVIHFAADHSVSDEEVAQTVQLKVQSGVCSREQAVKEIHPDWTVREVEDELARIEQDEQWQTLVATGAFPGGPADPARQPVEEGGEGEVPVAEE